MMSKIWNNSMYTTIPPEVCTHETHIDYLFECYKNEIDVDFIEGDEYKDMDFLQEENDYLEFLIAHEPRKPKKRMIL